MTTDRDSWEHFATVDPYYWVLTEERFRLKAIDDRALDDFYRTGEEEARHLLSTAEKHFGADLRGCSALEFGCGAGRLAIPLAMLGLRVSGVDVSPTMLQLARARSERTGAGVTFLEGSTEVIGSKQFDLVYSVIVLQHLGRKAGYDAIRALQEAVATGGIVALQVPYRRPGSILRRLARVVRSRSGLVNSLVNRFKHLPPGTPYLRMTTYDMNAVVRGMRMAGFSQFWVESTNHGGVEGALIMSRRDGRVDVHGAEET